MKQYDKGGLIIKLHTNHGTTRIIVLTELVNQSRKLNSRYKHLKKLIPVFMVLKGMNMFGNRFLLRSVFNMMDDKNVMSMSRSEYNFILC